MSRLGIEQTIINPDKVLELGQGQKKFIKQQGSRLYQTIALWKEKEQLWLIISVWVKGEEDRPDLLWRLLTAPFRFLRFLWHWFFV